ncbi:MAG: glucosamine--fructose-6-phosphate aminotransferase [Bryobacteraceae bacterium]|nr:MAG: glucosamine--fructose-6-phosphate aminotransferase [Bryobacteraceae bacterium]
MSKMIEEIRQQPVALEKTLRGGLRQSEALRKRFQQRPPRLVVLAARGTSDNAAQFGRYLIEITTGIPVSLAAPSVSTLYHAPLDLKDALLVGISQSGESTDTNMVLEEGRQHGAMTLGITNEAGSSMARLSDEVLLVRAGKELSVAATKTYTGQLMAFYLLARALGAPIGLGDLERLPSLAAAALKLEPEVTARAERYRFMQGAVVVGRGLNYANAFEWALKLMETCYVVAERFSQADILHGPIAMVSSALPAFLFTPPGVTWPVMRELIERLKQMQVDMLAITDRSNREVPAGAIVIPARAGLAGRKSADVLPEDVFTPIPYIIPAQIFAASLARVKGLNPDQPRGLSKVTRTL